MKTATVDGTGLHVPTYDEVFDDVVADFRQIYGDDVYIDADSQDGQLLALFALALHDANSMVAAVYNSFAPSTAVGVGLSRVVKVNGIERAVASFSTVDLRVVGQAGTIVSGGVAKDTASQSWLLADFVIPPSGETIVTATASVKGALRAPAGSIAEIATPTLGWQEVENLSDAAPGAPVERDVALRARQRLSTALPSRTILDSMSGAILALPGVVRIKTYENDGGGPDVNGVPGGSIAFVVDGGDSTQIAETIFLKKSPGVRTFGSTAITVTDAYGIPHVVRFQRPDVIEIGWRITVKPLLGYSALVQERIRQSLVDWTNLRDIGEDVLISRAALPANLYGGGGSETFQVLSIEAKKDGGAFAPTDVPVAFDEAPHADLDGVEVVVLTS